MCCGFQVGPTGGQDVSCSTQEAGRGDIVASEGLKPDSGGNEALKPDGGGNEGVMADGGSGEPSVLDNVASRCTTMTSDQEKSVCCLTDLKTDHSHDNEESTTKWFAVGDSASGEPAPPGVALDDSLFADQKMVEEHLMVADVSALTAALQGDGRDDSLCDHDKMTDDYPMVDDVLTSQDTEPDGDNTVTTEDNTKVDDVSTLQDTGPDAEDKKVTTEHNTKVDDVSTSCADISSGVSHMDIDISEETSESAISPGSSLVVGICKASRFDSNLNRLSDSIHFERDWPIRKFLNRIGRT